MVEKMAGYWAAMAETMAVEWAVWMVDKMAGYWAVLTDEKMAGEWADNSALR